MIIIWKKQTYWFENESSQKQIPEQSIQIWTYPCQITKYCKHHWVPYKQETLRTKKEDKTYALQLPKKRVVQRLYCNAVKRFKRVDYLNSWSSKKPIYSICEDRTVSRLTRKVQLLQGCRSVI